MEKADLKKHFRDIASIANNDHPEDVKEAIRQAIECAKSSPYWHQFIIDLAEMAITDMVYDARHFASVSAKRESGQYSQTYTAQSEGSSVRSINEGILQLRIGGSTLGATTPNETPRLIDQEKSLAEGHLKNASILQAFYDAAKKKAQKNKKLLDMPYSRIFRPHEIAKLVVA